MLKTIKDLEKKHPYLFQLILSIIIPFIFNIFSYLINNTFAFDFIEIMILIIASQIGVFIRRNT